MPTFIFTCEVEKEYTVTINAATLGDAWCELDSWSVKDLENSGSPEHERFSGWLSEEIDDNQVAGEE